jgi:regulatory protein
MSDPGDEPIRAPRAARKAPRKVSPSYLENAALHHLGRYATTRTGLRRVLLRKVDRSLRVHGGDRSEALGWVDALVEKLAGRGLVNDRAYAETKARSLRAAGRSGRTIARKLQTKGVAAAVVTETLAEATADVPEEAAARIWARKKRLGPFRRDPETRADNRQRDLASLARAGFSFAVARRIVDGAAE